jgi:hypothetical protein
MKGGTFNIQHSAFNEGRGIDWGLESPQNPQTRMSALRHCARFLEDEDDPLTRRQECCSVETMKLLFATGAD